jgi:hypothetical protein
MRHPTFWVCSKLLWLHPSGEMQLQNLWWASPLLPLSAPPWFQHPHAVIRMLCTGTMTDRISSSRWIQTTSPNSSANSSALNHTQDCSYQHPLPFDVTDIIIIIIPAPTTSWCQDVQCSDISALDPIIWKGEWYQSYSEATYKMSTSEMPSATMADVRDVLDVPMYTNVSVTGCQPTKQIPFFETVTRVP